MSKNIDDLKKKFLIQGIKGKLSSQQLFVSLSEVDDLLLTGGRGGGKTEALLADCIFRFKKHTSVELNFVFLRNLYGALQDPISKLKVMARKFLNEDDYKFYNQDGYTVFVLIKDKKKKITNFSDIRGSRIYFRAAKSVKDYEDKFHGSNFDGIYIDELSTFCPKLANMLKDTLRTSKDIKPVFRAATNPWGMYVKEVYDEYIHNKEYGKIYEVVTKFKSIDPLTGDEYDDSVVVRKGAIFSSLDENYHLPKDYKVKLITNNINSEKTLNAYVLGIFDFSDSRFLHIDREKLVIPQFYIPKQWASTSYISYDDGTSSPFSALWFVKATTDSYINHKGDLVKVPIGTLFVINEFHGSKPFLNMRNGGKGYVLTQEDKDQVSIGLDYTHSKIAELIKNDNNGKVRAMLGGYVSKCGPADTSIKKNDRGQGGKTVYDIFKANGLDWGSAIKGNNSRVDNANYLKNMIKATYDEDMLQPHIYFFDIHTDMLMYNLENLKTNPNNPDDILDENKDHDYDALRYGITHSRKTKGKIVNRY